MANAASYVRVATAEQLDGQKSTIRAIGYVRVSSDDQKESGGGELAQAEACRQAALRNGWELVGPFVEDEAVSGGTPFDRCPALVNALGEVRKGDVLIVAKRDRISRDRFKILMLEASLKKRRARLVSAAGEGTDFEDPDDPVGLMLRGMIDLFAEYERLMAKVRTRAALRAMRKANRRTGRVPIGYDLVDDGRRSRKNGLPIALVENPDEQAVIRQILLLRSQALTFRAIADLVNAGGFKTKEGAPISHSTVAYLYHYHSKEQSSAPSSSPAIGDPTESPARRTAPRRDPQ